MSVFKCKMCGGTLELKENQTTAVCEYCGVEQTLPKLDDSILNMYDRANHFRRNNEFDKAMSMYEKILNEDNTDAEAYWSLVLCRYGIEYVEEKDTRVPTINRTQFTSIFDDDNYKMALKYADASQKKIYEKEAKAINEIQKGILDISNNEEPFDVFICYKETDNNGRRTKDSVLANELYHELVNEGFKVFFSRITLEDKIGTAYEPYIFNALNSSKIMVVMGTKPEYFQAPWVKNEWSRFLTLIKNGQKKTLVPAYRDMDPYDLPEEFSHLQAQDMSKLGFMPDLIRGIKKIMGSDAPQKEKKETIKSDQNIDSLIDRMFMFLEDGEWNLADEYCEKVLKIDSRLAEAYLGKFLAENRCKDLKDYKEKRLQVYVSRETETEFIQVIPPEEDIENINHFIEKFAIPELFSNEAVLNEIDAIPLAYNAIQIDLLKNMYDNDVAYLDHNKNLCRAIEFSDGKSKTTIKNKVDDIKHSIDDVITRFTNSNEAKKQKMIDNYSQSLEKTEIKLQKLHNEIKEKHYEEAIQKMKSKQTVREAYHTFGLLENYKESKNYMMECQKEISKLNKRNCILGLVAIVIGALFIYSGIFIYKEISYNKAMTLYEKRDYEKALKAFEAMNHYKDSEKKIQEMNQELDELYGKTYQEMKGSLDKADYEKALTIANDIPIYYKDMQEKIEYTNAMIDVKDVYDNITNRYAEDIKYLKDETKRFFEKQMKKGMYRLSKEQLQNLLIGVWRDVGYESIDEEEIEIIDYTFEKDGSAIFKKKKRESNYYSYTYKDSTWSIYESNDNIKIQFVSYNVEKYWIILDIGGGFYLKYESYLEDPSYYHSPSIMRKL